MLHGIVVDALWRLGDGDDDGRPPRLEALYVRVLTPQAPPLPATVALPAPTWTPPRAVWIPIPVLPPMAAASAPVPDGDPAPGRPAAGGVDRPRAPGEGTGDGSGAGDAMAGTDAGLPAQDDPAGGAAASVADAAATRAAEATPLAPASAPAPATVAGGPDAGGSSDPAATGDGFDWPPSTRLRYALTGHWRGPIEGRAQVEWVREGNRYQVHLDVLVGLPVVPVITRQTSSDGTLGPGGLSPRRYDERTRVLWRDPVAATILFEPGLVRLPGGRVRPAPPGVQDAASQFVHLAWRFARDPSLLTEGRALTVPLALPRQVSDWVYDVRETETLATPAGPVPAVRLQPRRRARPGGDLVPEVWFAPSLQYLPVRILVRHGDDSFVDLTIDRLPEQAARPTSDAAGEGVTAPPANVERASPRRRPPRP